MANELCFDAPDSTCYGENQQGHFTFNTIFECGYNKDSPFDNLVDGALRFPNIPLDRGQWFATADVVINVGTNSGESYYGKIYGIDDDNVGPFGDPFGMSKTDANSDFYIYQTHGGDQLGFGVGSMLNEIINRGGWRKGNAVGFIFQANDLCRHGNQSNYFASVVDSYLSIRLTPEPNFKPTPQVSSAQPFPAPSKTGLKIAMPGINVNQATRAQLVYTSDERLPKVLAEGEVTLETPWQNIAIPHNQTSQPAYLCYMDVNGVRHKMPVYQHGYVRSDAQNVKIYTDAAHVYYYVFNDKLA